MKKEYSNKEVQWVQVTKCKQHPDNPHVVSEPDVKKIQATLAIDGLQNPIEVVIRDTGEFEPVAGNTRLAAVVAEGWDEIPAIIKKFDNREAELRYMILSNFSHDKASLEVAVEMALWKRIWAKPQGTRTDLIEGEDSENGSTRERLATMYNVSEATVGKYEYILSKGKQYFQLIDDGKISLEGAYQLARFVNDAGIAASDETELMTRVVDQTDKNFFEQIEKGEMDLPTAFSKCVRLLGKKMKPAARKESSESSAPPINSSKVNDTETYLCEHGGCPCFGQYIKITS